MTTDTLTRTRHASEGGATGLTPPVPQDGQPSLILALHARYEAAWEEYNRVDRYCTELASGDDLERTRCDGGLRANVKETDLLRYAILHQIPQTDEELTVLAFHAEGIQEAMGGDPRPDDLESLSHALNSMFDYLLRQNRAAMSDLGKQFESAGTHAWHRCRYRTGKTIDD